MSNYLTSFRSTILEGHFAGGLPGSLKISTDRNLATYYAPFEHINESARIVLVGITPGVSQANTALTELRRQLSAGASDQAGLRAAKETASFSGSMRKALVELLNSIGIAASLRIDDCAALFDEARELVHYTSALRYPVLSSGQNYSGNPAILRTPYLIQMVDKWLAEEAALLPDALWVPLGREPTAALGHLVSTGVLKETRVLSGLPHPSGANAERISYFLGRKPRELLSSKTNAASLDQARESLMRKVACFG